MSQKDMVSYSTCHRASLFYIEMCFLNVTMLRPAESTPGLISM